MSEADGIEQLVEYMNVLMMGVSVFFTIVSAYVVALYAFLARAGFFLKLFAFAFFTAAIGFLIVFFLGAQTQHEGLLQTLFLIEQTHGLSPAGEAALANSAGGIDARIETVMWAVGLGFYIAAFFLTFFPRLTLRATTD